MVICAAPAYLARYGTPTTPADPPIISACPIRWTARNEWKLPGAEEGVRWKRDAVLRCNDGYALRRRRSPGPGC
jgi:DNA-binding transcriptional LysR family regulator